MQGSDAHPHTVRDGPGLFAGPHAPHGPPELLQVHVAWTQAFHGERVPGFILKSLLGSH